MPEQSHGGHEIPRPTLGRMVLVTDGNGQTWPGIVHREPEPDDDEIQIGVTVFTAFGQEIWEEIPVAHTTIPHRYTWYWPPRS